MKSFELFYADLAEKSVDVFFDVFPDARFWEFLLMSPKGGIQKIFIFFYVK
jgi:hypothetical protein